MRRLQKCPRFYSEFENGWRAKGFVQSKFIAVKQRIEYTY